MDDSPVAAAADNDQVFDMPMPAKMPETQGQFNYTTDVDPTREVSSAAPTDSEGRRTRKVTIRQAVKDKGVFETGVDVLEHEVELDEDEDGRI